MRDSYRHYLRTTAEQRKVPGLSALVHRGNEVLFDEGVGYADREAQRPATPDTVFGIGSITKSFTTLSIMQLVDAGKLRVEDRVADYLPAFARSGDTDLSGVRLHHLMTNSSGLPPLPFLHNALSRSVLADVSKELLQIKEEDYLPAIDSTDELVQAIADAGVRLIRPPGTIFSYSNDGFAMLGRIVELVSGRRYTDYVEENVLAPLGMSRSLFDHRPLAAMDDVTELYSYIGGFDRVEATPGWWEAPSMTSAGFLKSTTRDMARYAEVYLGRRPDLVSPESLVRMTSPHIRTSPGRYYGYGLMVQPDYHGHRLVEHGGNIKGVAAYMTMFPDEQLVSVTLANITGAPIGEMVLAGLNLAVGLPTETPREDFPTVQLTPAQEDRLLGTYTSGEDASVTLRRDEQGVLVAETKSATLTLRTVGETAVLIDVNGQPALMEFIDPTADGYAAVTFGYRVLEKTA